MSKFNWKPVRSIKECDEILTAPGQFHELEHAIIDGAVYRVYKNVWPSLRQYWLSIVTNNPKVHPLDYIIFEGSRLSYGQADHLVQRVASIFRENYGVRKGDRVGIAMRNYPEWIISFFAAGLLGAVPTLFNSWLPAEPTLHCINITTPKLLVVDSERLEVLRPHLHTLHLSIIFVRPTPSTLQTDRGVKEWSRVLAEYSGPTTAWKNEPEPHPDDDATIFFTSGTTGFSKAVLSSQRGFLGNFFNFTYAARRRELRLGQDLPPPIGQGPVPDVQPPQITGLLAAPLFHVAGCTSQLVNGTATGTRFVLLPKWDKEEAARLFVKEKVMTFVSVPSLVYDLMETGLVGNTNINGIGIGGAPAADTLVGEMVQKFPNPPPLQIAILSSDSSRFLINSQAIRVRTNRDEFARSLIHGGLPLGIVDLLVVDPNTNKVLPRGQIGELWIRGPNVMRRYFNNPTATAEVLTRDGWLKTGDLAIIDDEGFVYIKDRVKDMIIRGGENIYSVTVENAFFLDNRVLDCAVVGIPDKRLGEIVGAAVVPRKEWLGRLSEDDLLQKVKSSLPAYAIPSIVLIQNEAFERNAAGKVLKDKVRKSLASAWERREKVNSKL